MNQTEFENILKRRLYLPTPRAEQHLKLCMRMAEVPWAYGDTRAEFMGTRIDNLFGDITVTRGDMRLSGRDTPEFIEIARSMLAGLEMEYVASAFCPTAKWEFDRGFAGMVYARIPGIEIARLAFGDWTLELRDANGFVGSICEVSPIKLHRAYLKRRHAHDAARGVKTRQPKSAQALPSWVNYAWEAQALWYPPDLHYITIEHARNILACMADPEKYTRIARWAKCNPLQAARVMRTALEVTK